MGLLSRIDRIERGAAASWRTVLVKPGYPRGLPAGSIVPWPSGAGFTLVVPAEHESDPMAGLDWRQKTLLRPNDRIISVARGPREDL